MTNEEFVIRIKAGIDTGENMLQLWEQNKRFIHSVAMRYQGKAEIEDLEQEGYLALYDAIDGFNPNEGCKFLTYAEHWIKMRMQRFISSCCGTIRIPEYEMQKHYRYKRFVNEFRVYLGRKPMREELGYYLDMTEEELHNLEKSIQMAQVTSLDRELSADDTDNGTVGDTVADTTDVEGSVLEDTAYLQLRAALWPAVDSLPAEQAAVLKLRFVQGMTYQEAGDNIGSTKDKARRLESKALHTLRYSEYAPLLRCFLDCEEIYSQAIVGTGARRFNTTWTSATERTALRL